MSQRPTTSQEKLAELSKRLDDYDRKQEPPAKLTPRPIAAPKTGMSKVALVLWLCFIWTCNLGVIVLQIAAMAGAIEFEGVLPTWGDVAEQVFAGLLLSVAIVAFSKFINRTRRFPPA